MKWTLLIFIFLSTSAKSIENDSIEFLQWYTQKKEQYASSKKYISRLERKVSENQIQGIELIIAQGTDEQVQSKFGHALFRFVDNDDDPGNDITISFVADVNGPKASNVSGVIGKYGVYPEVKSLRLFIKQYVKNQSRPLERFLIPSNKEMRNSLIQSLHEWWDEIHDAREVIYLESLHDARKKAKKKGEELFGLNNYELFELKFYDSEFDKEVTQSFGILEKEASPFQTLNEKDKALYRQAYQKSYREISPSKEQHVINLHQELWLIEKHESILELTELDYDEAKSKAEKILSTKGIKLFKNFDKDLKHTGYISMSNTVLNELRIIKKSSISLTVKNLEIKSVESESLGKYTFFSNNCAGAVIKFLKKSNFPHKRAVGIQGRVPVKLHKWMSRSLLVPYPSLKINGAQKLKSKIARILGFSEKEFETYRFPEHQWKIISKYISINDKFLFFDLYSAILSESYIDKVRKEIEFEQAPNYNDLYELKLTPDVFYKLCKNKACGDSIKTEMKKVWSSKEIKKAKKLINRTGNNLFIYSGLKSRPEVLTHLKSLDYIPKKFGN